MTLKYYLLIAFVVPIVLSDNDIQHNPPTLLLEGKTVVLHCNRTDSPAQVLPWNWKKDGTLYTDLPDKDRYSVKDNTFTIENANKNDIGKWTCSLGDLFAEIPLNTRPFLLPFEEYQKTNYKSANVIEGERFFLRCALMEGYSRGASISWYRYNESEHDDPNKYLHQLTLEDTKNGHMTINDSNPIDQTLVIEKVVPSDRYYYVCEATNDVTNFNNTILLRVKDKLGALWPFLGIVAEVIILCTIIFIYEKRRIKPDFDDSDNDNNTEPKSTQDRSSKSQDVRQRK